MFGNLAKKLFGSSNERRLKAYTGRVSAINALEPEISALSDAELRARTQEFRADIAAGKTLDDSSFRRLRRCARLRSGLSGSAISTSS